MPRYKSKLNKSSKKNIKDVVEDVVEKVQDKINDTKKDVKKVVGNKIEESIAQVTTLFQHPEHMVHFLETLDNPSRVFNVIKIIGKQTVGLSTPFHPKYIDVLPRGNTLIPPIKDIIKNAGSLVQLSGAIAEEANETERNGWHLFKSLKHILKGATNHIYNSVNTLQNDNNQEVGKYFAKGHLFIKPIAQAIDSFTKETGGVLGLKATNLQYFSQELLSIAKNQGKKV